MAISSSKRTITIADSVQSNNKNYFDNTLFAQNMPKRGLTPPSRTSSPSAQRHAQSRREQSKMHDQENYSPDNGVSIQNFIAAVLQSTADFETAGKIFANTYAFHGHFQDYTYASHMFEEAENIYAELYNAYPARAQTQRAMRAPIEQ